MMPDQPAEVVLAERRYRHADGREVILSARHGPAHGGGAALFYSVTITGPDNQAVPAIDYAIGARDRPQARRVWVERARQLRALGFERVEVV